MTGATAKTLPVVMTENREARGPFLIVCEHASNHFPAAFGTLGLTPEARSAHIAWDPGAFNLARGLSKALDAPLVAANLSRLVYDLNRPPHAAGAMAERSEVYDIPGNADLAEAERLRRTEAIYLPFHAALHAEIARRLATGRPPVIVTVHSFTPVYFGQHRNVELGVIHDADPTFATAVLAEAKALTGLDCRMNEPYSAADGVTHTLRLQATPYGLHHVMLEIRNDLLADDLAVAAMTDGLAPVLAAALARIGAGTNRKAAI
ncbi:N-formylglutamate amidohydrolase [Defluviimonas sp. WL0024]|uniref:N-formylglutamate amidohydrolase n=1 Tax=Albidovulum salinarum TaxID=2984153 RepID=A0ABT2X0E3_9RHOB|nr:N-formylglutamate amidohydrolase [Defluviimonas sp. WL0024]MCU9847394.1 N-formylglutamate amidohydrolase [Defluviimonas sp. WL0024]